jgi:hypothetical protein
MALGTSKPINRESFHSRLRPHRRSAHRAGDDLSQPFSGEVDMKIFAPVHDGADHQVSPDPGDDVRVFPSKPFSEFDIMLVHG